MRRQTEVAARGARAVELRAQRVERRARHETVTAKLGVARVPQRKRIYELIAAAASGRSAESMHRPPVEAGVPIPRTHRRPEREKRAEQVESGLGHRLERLLRQRVMWRHERRNAAPEERFEIRASALNALGRIGSPLKLRPARKVL